MRVPKSVKSLKKKKKHKPLYVAYMYLSPWKFFRNQILLDYLGRWRNQSCQIFFQSVHSGVCGKGSKFAISSANRGWPLQLLYYRTTVIFNLFCDCSNVSCTHLRLSCNGLQIDGQIVLFGTRRQQLPILLVEFVSILNANLKLYSWENRK